jgi:APA family basic amino acid/polyamine antiporter
VASRPQSRDLPGSGQAPGGAGDQLARRLGTADAVVIGMGSMIGAGVFSAFGPAARAAGTGLLIGLAVAAVIAYCNAVASAQLAAVYPTSGGTYIYGRERLGHWMGFVAGWGFVVGKTASCAAIALTFASYAVPGPWWVQRAVAVAGVLGLAALNYRGVTKTAKLTRVLVATSLTALAVVVVSIAAGGQAGTANLGGWHAVGTGGGFRVGREGGWGVYGILQAGGLLFFAFAGYARIATMGEEVRDPRRTIPRAIQLALFITAGIYLVVALAALLAAGPDRLAAAAAPLTTAVHAAGAGPVAPVVRVGGALAALGSLLALIAGIGRTGLAMARHGDLPGWLSAVHPHYRVPHHAEVALAVVVSVLVATIDLRGAIGFSSFGVLVYYAIANVAAFTQPAQDRRWPRGLNVLGVAGCLTLVATLPWQSVIAGLAMFAIGLVGRAIALARRGR